MKVQLTPHKILDTQQFSAEVSKIFSDSSLAYKKGMGIKLLKQAPKEIQDRAIAELKKLEIKKNDLIAIDKALLNIQLDICNELHNQHRGRIETEIMNTERLMNSFDKVEVIVPELTGEQKLFTGLPGSNIDKHLGRTEELKQAVNAIRESPVYNKPPAQMSSEERQQVTKSINAVIKEKQSIEKELQTLKPDEVTIDSAFIEASRNGESKKIDTLKILGYAPRPIAQEKIMGLIVEEGSLGKQTIQAGKTLGLGEEIEVKTAQNNRSLLTDPQLDTLKRDPRKTINPSPSKEAEIGIKAKSYADSIYIESGHGTPSKDAGNKEYKAGLKDDLLAIARRHNLKLVNSGTEQPEELSISQAQSLSKGR